MAYIWWSDNSYRVLDRKYYTTDKSSLEFRSEYRDIKMAMLSLWPPFDDTVVHSRASGCLYILMNIIWLLTGGLWIAATHAIFGVLLCITIIGIPFGLQHFKLIMIALFLLGETLSFKWG